MLPAAKTYGEKLRILRDLLKLIREYEKIANYDELFLNAHYLLLNILEEVQIYNGEEMYEDLSGIRAYIQDLKSCEAKMMVLNQFKI